MPTHLSPFDPIGPLQLRIMNHLWKVNAATVQEVGDALNGQPGAPRMAYTTFLTVMRNLAKRKILDQRRVVGAKRHQFASGTSLHAAAQAPTCCHVLGSTRFIHAETQS